jgi:hypothetical protein
MKCDLIFYTNLSEKFLIVTGNGRDNITNEHRFSGKVPIILVKF